MARLTQDWGDQLNLLDAPPASDWPADEVASATRTAARLSALARDLIGSGTIPAVCGDPHDCPLAVAADARACDLARLLARSRFARTLPAASAGADPALTCRMFLDAVARAGAAVYACRRVLHTSGECLFGDDGNGHDLCGRLLVAAHRLGGPAGL